MREAAPRRWVRTLVRRPLHAAALMAVKPALTLVLQFFLDNQIFVAYLSTTSPCSFRHCNVSTVEEELQPRRYYGHSATGARGPAWSRAQTQTNPCAIPCPWVLP